MIPFFSYMIRLAFSLILLYIFYKAFLSRETFFRLNRFILLGGISLCLLISAFRMEVGERFYSKIGIFQIENFFRNGGREQDYIVLSEFAPTDLTFDGDHTLPSDQPVSMVVNRITASEVVFVLYLLGALVVLCWLLLAFYRMVQLVRRSGKLKYGKYTLVLTSEVVCPFSWGKYIVMSKTDYDAYPDEILIHEQIHADKRHCVDLVIAELLLILQWFNPVVWLLKKELQEIHEYEADEGVIEKGIDATKYQLLLVKKAVGARLYSIANSFNHSKLKNRITMMLKEKSNCRARLKVMIFVPVAVFLMMAFARPSATLSQVATASEFKITQFSDGEEMNSQKNDSCVLLTIDTQETTDLGETKQTIRVSAYSLKDVDKLIEEIRKDRLDCYKNANVVNIYCSKDMPSEYYTRVKQAFRELGVAKVNYKHSMLKSSQDTMKASEDYFIGVRSRKNSIIAVSSTASVIGDSVGYSIAVSAPGDSTFYFSGKTKEEVDKKLEEWNKSRRGKSFRFTISR